MHPSPPTTAAHQPYILHCHLQGWAFLLPTVTPEDAKAHFPNHSTCAVPSGIDYLRLTPASELT